MKTKQIRRIPRLYIAELAEPYGNLEKGFLTVADMKGIPRSKEPKFVVYHQLEEVPLTHTVVNVSLDFLIGYLSAAFAADPECAELRNGIPVRLPGYAEIRQYSPRPIDKNTLKSVLGRARLLGEHRELLK